MLLLNKYIEKMNTLQRSTSKSNVHIYINFNANKTMHFITVLQNSDVLYLLVANILGWKALAEREVPCLVFVNLSLNSRNSLPLEAVCSTTSPHCIWICSCRPRSPKCIVLCNHSVFMIAWGVPTNYKLQNISGCNTFTRKMEADII